MTEPVYVQWRTGKRLSKVHAVRNSYGVQDHYFLTHCGLQDKWENVVTVERGPNPCRKCLNYLVISGA